MKKDLKKFFYQNYLKKIFLLIVGNVGKIDVNLFKALSMLQLEIYLFYVWYNNSAFMFSGVTDYIFSGPDSTKITLVVL